MVRQIRGRLVGAEWLTKLRCLDVPGVTFDFQQARLLALPAAETVQAGTPGYTLIIVSKPGP